MPGGTAILRIVITGSAGYLGEALARHFTARGDSVTGIDIVPSRFTTVVGSIADDRIIETAVESADVILHTATLHKPHLVTHSKQQFITVNVSGTQKLLEAAVKFKLKAFVFTSTTSLYGRALTPANAAGAVWVTEDLQPKPKNIYGVTKLAAENLCELVHRDCNLPCVVLRTSRFFPGDDIPDATLMGASQENIKAIEFLGRRVDITDVVTAHVAAVEKAAQIGFNKFIVSASTPFQFSDCLRLWNNPGIALKDYFPDIEKVFAAKNWRLPQKIGRIYVNNRARQSLDWHPKVGFREVTQLGSNADA
jgi:UDP-glucose 4-epimerase